MTQTEQEQKEFEEFEEKMKLEEKPDTWCYWCEVDTAYTECICEGGY